LEYSHTLLVSPSFTKFHWFHSFTYILQISPVYLESINSDHTRKRSTFSLVLMFESVLLILQFYLTSTLRNGITWNGIKDSGWNRSIIWNGSSVEGLIEHDCAYVAWINRLLDPFPILAIENCSRGGQRVDYTMLATHPL
jgi:alpha-galactosidase